MRKQWKQKTARTTHPQPSLPRTAPKNNFLLQHLQEYVEGVAGRKGWRVLAAVGDSATDETIEDKTRLKMAEVRARLNQLHAHGLVEYTREKDLSSGWFTYTWRFNLDRAMQNFFTAKRNELQGLRNKLSAEEGVLLYACRRGCARLPFDSAAENSFRCPKCGSKMRFFDNKSELRKINQRISVLEKILEHQSRPAPLQQPTP